MGSKSRTASRPESPREAMTAAILRLSDQLECVGDVLEAIRSELKWITSNGLPIQIEGDRVAVPSAIPRQTDDAPEADVPTLDEILEHLTRATGGADPALQARYEQALAILSPSPANPPPVPPPTRKPPASLF